MDVTETFDAPDRDAWRAWLDANHATKSEIWLVMYGRKPGGRGVSYLHAVEEAICFGWIDGLAKKLDDERSAQRFTPRRPNSNWTELNKERARRLIAQGKMTPAGAATLPDLDVTKFKIAPDILSALQADSETWANFERFPALYQRVRISYIEEMRKRPAEFQTRLDNFLSKTKQGKKFGNWNDGYDEEEQPE